MKISFFSIIIAGFLLPQITFAAWWNPSSWFKNQQASLLELPINNAAENGDFDKNIEEHLDLEELRMGRL